MNLKVVHVEWLDSTAHADWDEVEEVLPLTLTHSAGFLIKKTKNSLVLALSFDPDTGAINAYKQIPLKAIRKIKNVCTIKMKT